MVKTENFVAGPFGGNKDCNHQWESNCEKGWDMGLTDDGHMFEEDQYGHQCTECGATKYDCVIKIFIPDLEALSDDLEARYDPE